MKYVSRIEQTIQQRLINSLLYHGSRKYRNPHPLINKIIQDPPTNLLENLQILKILAPLSLLKYTRY